MEIQNQFIGQKFIRTVNGPILKDQFCGNFNQGSVKNFPITVLPYEHIIQNLCDFIIPSNEINKEEQIKIENLSDFHLNAFCSFKNLYLENDAAKAANELSYLKMFNCYLIVDATTVSNGLNTDLLKEISNMSGVHICYGYTLKEDFYNSSLKFNFEKIHNEIRYELTFGYNDLIPSFIGEILISDDFPNENEEKLFQILFSILEEFKIPIYIKLNSKSKYETKVFDYLKNNLPFRMKSLSYLLVFVYCPEDSFDQNCVIDFFTENILESGFSLIIGLYDCDLIKVFNIKEKQMRDEDIDSLYNEIKTISLYYCKEKAMMINSLLRVKEKKYIKQIMLSNNINFKVQLKQYGGFGYGNIFKNYYDKIIIGLSEDEINSIFKDNILHILTWWSPPPKVEKKVNTVICSK